MIGAGLTAAKRGARARSSASAWAGGEAWPRAALAQLRVWADRERGRFVLFAPLLMIAGIAGYLSLLSEPPAWAGPGAVVIGAGGWWVGARRDDAGLRLVARCFFFAALGFGLVQARSASVAAPTIRAETPPVTVEGVLERAERRGGGVRYTVQVIRVAAFAEADAARVRRRAIGRRWAEIARLRRDVLLCRRRFFTTVGDAREAGLCELGIRGFLARFGLARRGGAPAFVLALVSFVDRQPGYAMFAAHLRLEREAARPRSARG